MRGRFFFSLYEVERGGEIGRGGGTKEYRQRLVGDTGRRRKKSKPADKF